MDSSEPPRYLVNKYVAYLHGNPHKTRKVVLDDEMIRNGKVGDITIFPRHELKAWFLATVKEETGKARANEETLLLMAFGHGRPLSHGIEIGPVGKRKANVVTIVDIRQAIKGTPLPSLVTTACNSGGWSVDPNFNASTLAAAGPKRHSVSWGASAVAGRSCGFVWSSALVSVLLEEGSRREPSLEPPANPRDDVESQLTEYQTKTYGGFCCGVWNQLYSKVDRLAASHEIRFRAQDDDWEVNWSKRSGIPLGDHREQYDGLKDYPTSGLEGPLTNRDVEVPEKIDEDTLRSLTMTGEKPSSVDSASQKSRAVASSPSLLSVVQRPARIYFDSLAGLDNEPRNASLHRAGA